VKFHSAFHSVSIFAITPRNCAPDLYRKLYREGQLGWQGPPVACVREGLSFRLKCIIYAYRG